MSICEECGSGNLRPVRDRGVVLQECALCGALAGDDAAVTRALLDREAHERGADPAIYPLVHTLQQIDGLRVTKSFAGDAEARVWPFIQMIPDGPGAWKALERLAKSLALAAIGHDIHWVVEIESQNRLVLTLKPRFHRGITEIAAELVAAARRDLDRLQRSIERDMRLSWWR